MEFQKFALLMTKSGPLASYQEHTVASNSNLSRQELKGIPVIQTGLLCDFVLLWHIKI